jgi:AraC-like DNA-binding protein
MNDKVGLRIWRKEGIGEFLHVSNFAHPTTKILHQSLEICFVEQGAYRVIHCGVNYSVGEGMLLVAQVGGFTTCEDFQGKSKYRIFQCDLGALEKIAEETGNRFSGGRLFQCPFMCDESLGRLFLRFHTEMDSNPSALESSTLLRELVGEMLLRYGNRRAAILRLGNERWAVKRVRDCLESRYAENVTLDELARIANLTPFHLVRVFRKEVGLPPHAYQTRVRLNRARALLAQEATIGEAALNSGFFDQSHFTNHFRRVFGYTPGAYWKGLASGSKCSKTDRRAFGDCAATKRPR